VQQTRWIGSSLAIAGLALAGAAFAGAAFAGAAFAGEPVQGAAVTRSPIQGAVKSAPPANRDYVNVRHGFRFGPPPGWQQRDQIGALTIYAEPQARAGSAGSLKSESTRAFTQRLQRSLNEPLDVSARFVANLTVTATPTSVRNATEYARALRTDGKLPKNFRIVGEAPFKLAGEPAVARSVQVSFPDQPAVRTREVLCVHGGYAISITLATEVGAYAKYKAVFDGVLQTFSWLPRTTP